MMTALTAAWALNVLSWQQVSCLYSPCLYTCSSQAEADTDLLLLIAAATHKPWMWKHLAAKHGRTTAYQSLTQPCEPGTAQHTRLLLAPEQCRLPVALVLLVLVLMLLRAALML